jgi:hypothetical protein
MPNIEPLDGIWKGKAWSDGERVTRVAQTTGSTGGTVAEGVASLGYAWNPSTSTYVKIPVDPGTGGLLVSAVPASGVPQAQDSKLLAWNFPVEYCNAGYQPSGGVVFAAKILLSATVSNVKNVVVTVNTPGATLTAGQNLAALYNSGGTQIGATTADQSSNWTTVGMKTMQVSAGGVTVSPPFVVVALLANGTTAPAFARGYSSNAVNGNLVATDVFKWSNSPAGGITSLPGSIPITTYVANPQAVWAGLS